MSYFKDHGITIMSVLFAIFLIAFVITLIIYIIRVKNEPAVPFITTWTGNDQGKNVFFGTNSETNQFFTYTASFEVIGVTVDDVSRDFSATLSGPPVIGVRFVYGDNMNFATLLVDPDGVTRHTVQLSRLNLQSLTPAFNAAQDVPQSPTLFNQFYI
jgi:hypothetical protein